jgi:hypothetical protein
MLVLHPKTWMVIAGPLGELVSVGISVSVDTGAFVLVGMIALAVDVATAGVAVATPITTGVGVNIDGVGVAGRKGVGPGKGWMTQPLQDESRSVNKMGKMDFFIFSPLHSLYPACEMEQSPPFGFTLDCEPASRRTLSLLLLRANYSFAEKMIHVEYRQDAVSAVRTQIEASPDPMAGAVRVLYP